MPRSKSDAYRKAREIYDSFVVEPGDFLPEQVKLVMRKELSVYQGEAFAALVEDAYSKAEQRQKSAATGQRTLFDVGGVLVLKDNRRIGKRHAMLSHFEEHLQFCDANRAAVVAANDREHRIYDLLRPYWSEGVTMSQAIEAYRAEHPEDSELVA